MLFVSAFLYVRSAKVFYELLANWAMLFELPPFNVTTTPQQPS